MPLNWPPASGPGGNYCDAQLNLAYLDLKEEVAQAAEADPHGDFYPMYARMYVEDIGVPHQRRSEYRAALENILRTGHGTVEQVKALFSQTNGSGASS